MDNGQPIRLVAKRTGMSPHLIRIWERRYSAVNPDRTETGRRLYNDEDVERLILLRRATLEGHSISQIAGYSKEQLLTLVPKEELSQSSTINYDKDSSAEQQLNLCLQAMKNLDAVELEIRLLRASVSLGQRVFLEKLLHPMLEMTGEFWAEGRLSVSHEHLASAVVRSLLGSIYSSKSTNYADPLLIATTPKGQNHEFGALMATITAASNGWQTIYLGANLPAEDIAETINTRNADALALSIVYPPDDPEISEELIKIRKFTDNNLPLIIGGRSSGSYEKTLNDIKAIKVTSLVDLRQELEKLRIMKAHGTARTT